MNSYLVNSYLVNYLPLEKGVGMHQLLHQRVRVLPYSTTLLPLYVEICGRDACTDKTRMV